MADEKSLSGVPCTAPTRDEYDAALEQELAEARYELAAAESHIAELTKPPEAEDWKKLIVLAYKEDGDAVAKILRITAEYNRVRVQLSAFTQERDAAKADREMRESQIALAVRKLRQWSHEIPEEFGASLRGLALFLESYAVIQAANEQRPGLEACGAECSMCSGEYCGTHFDERCDCDGVDRHRLPKPPMQAAKEDRRG